MDFNDFQALAASTALYPGIGDNFIYPTLGLFGESGEVAEKVALLLDEGDLKDIAPVLCKELGDVLWYAAQVATELKTPLNEVALRVFTTPLLKDATLSVTPKNLAISTLMLMSATSSVAERVKKVQRDDEGVLTSKAHGLILFNLGNVLSRLAEISFLLNFSLEDVATLNTKKLLDRKERNLIKGDGDLR